MSLTPGPYTFTSEQLRTVWRDGLKTCPTFPKPGDERWKCESLYCDDFRWDEDGLRKNANDRKVSLTAFCINLLSRTADPATHFYAIDDKFSEILLCQYRASELDPPISEDLAIHHSVQLLTRLPSVVC
jgi:hypothetical protein